MKTKPIVKVAGKSITGNGNKRKLAKSEDWSSGSSEQTSGKSKEKKAKIQVTQKRHESKKQKACKGSNLKNAASEGEKIKKKDIPKGKMIVHTAAFVKNISTADLTFVPECKMSLSAATNDSDKNKSKEKKSQENLTSGHSHKSHTRTVKLSARGNSASSLNKMVSASVKKDALRVQQMRKRLAGSKSATTVPVSDNDPLDLLMRMEGHFLTGKNLANVATSSGVEAEEQSENRAMAMTDSELESMSDWEEVDDYSIAAEQSQVPDKPVEITLEMPDILKHRKRKKKAFDWKSYLARKVKQFKKKLAIDMHKVHLLCLLSLGMQQNEALNDPTLSGMLLSLLPPDFLAKKKLSEELQVQNLLLWYKRKFSLENISHCSNLQLVYVSLLRTIGLTVRLVLAFQPMPFKVPLDSEGQNERTSAKSKRKGGPAKKKLPALVKYTSTSSSSRIKKCIEKKNKLVSPSRHPSERESSKRAMMKTRSALQDDTDDDDDDDDTDDFTDVNDKESDNSEDSGKIVHELKKKKITVKTEISAKKKAKNSEEFSDGDSSSSETEFEECSSYFQSPGSLTKQLKILSNRKALSPNTSDDEILGHYGPQGHDFWLEVYFPEKKKWICFNCFKSQFGKPYSLENAATQPLTYVLGFKNDGSVKDVTVRYAKKWLSHTRKERVDSEWWTNTLFIFDQTPYKDILLEDDELKSQLLVRPLPSSIAEFKNHPLYALRRHLLKFEAIYPETAIPLGYIKKEPIYAKECVRTLHSRDKWLKEGHLVRLNEKPYKMVKSRPKWNKPKENPEALDLELYGEWQTEEYIPPPAINGQVPKNEYGNVELFKPWMLPGGTVQVRGQNMQRVAKKLNIDIAPAMVGWDHHSGYSHPVMDGWVVCEEFADTLMAAWEEEQEIQREKEVEKRKRRVYGNWRLLIRGLLIKERLKSKFLLAEKDEGQGEDTWPQNLKSKASHKQAAEVELMSSRKQQTSQVCLSQSKNDRACRQSKTSVKGQKRMYRKSSADVQRCGKTEERNVRKGTSVVFPELRRSSRPRQAKINAKIVQANEDEDNETDDDVHVEEKVGQRERGGQQGRKWSGLTRESLNLSEEDSDNCEAGQ